MTPLDLAGLALLLISALMLLPTMVLFIQLVVAPLLRQTREAEDGLARASNVVVLMPAHDEAANIASPIRAILQQLRPCDRLLVVADNCSDSTADVARAVGAEVIERRDALRRGKGYALDFGVRWLERDPPGVVVIIDADCIIDSQGLQRLAQRCFALTRPVQALYLMRAPTEAALGKRVAEFAWLVKNKARPLGSRALGWPCQLMGTGMAFPWPIVRDAALASPHLVEDMQLGVELAEAGYPPAFFPEVLVSSVFPVDAGASKAQRTRWEHGHLSVIARQGPRLLWLALKRGDIALVAMTLDLTVPPLAALVLLLIGLLLVDAMGWALIGAAGPLLLAVTALSLVAISVAAAWLRHGRHLVKGRELLALPLYAFGKIPIYVRLFTKRQVEWVRTKRDERSH